MRAGRRMAFDVGKARTGVAASDAAAILASPLATIEERSIDALIHRAFNLVEEVQPVEIYVGLPRNLRGESTLSTNMGMEFARKLQTLTTAEVRLVDERFTTKLAATAMHSAGLTAKQQKARIDAAAAVVILESALNQERHSAQKPGISVEEFDDEN